jgi:hypothetical protein
LVHKGTSALSRFFVATLVQILMPTPKDHTQINGSIYDARTMRPTHTNSNHDAHRGFEFRWSHQERHTIDHSSSRVQGTMLERRHTRGDGNNLTGAATCSRSLYPGPILSHLSSKVGRDDDSREGYYYNQQALRYR